MSDSRFRRKTIEQSTILPLNKQETRLEDNARGRISRPRIEGGEALHGLRGVASIIVVLYHSLLIISDEIEYGFGYKENTLLHQLPFIRVLFAGRAMTGVFFVLSGYILSFEMLRKSNVRQWKQVHEHLSSAMLKRGLRLFIPPLVTTFTTMLLFSAGAFDATSSPAFPTIRREDSLVRQTLDWIIESGRMLNLFRWHTVKTPYNPHLWTIAHEYRGSILLYGTLLACSRVKFHFRTLVFGLVLLNALIDGRVEIATLFCGAVLAEIQIWRTNRSHGVCVLSLQTRQLVCYASLLGGLYLLGFPVLAAAQTPGYRWLARSVPFRLEGYQWWHSVGSVLVVGTIVMSHELQRPLLHRSVQKLGEISFSIYLIHNPIIRLMIPFWVETLEDIGVTIALGEAGTYVLLSIVAWPILLCLSEMVFTWVDRPSVVFASWVGRQIQADDESADWTRYDGRALSKT